MIGYRKRTKLYAAQLPGHEGKDWGYTRLPRSEFDPAIELSPYWQRRFRANARACGDEAIFVNVSGADPRTH